MSNLYEIQRSLLAPEAPLIFGLELPDRDAVEDLVLPIFEEINQFFAQPNRFPELPQLNALNPPGGLGLRLEPIPEEHENEEILN